MENVSKLKTVGWGVLSKPGNVVGVAIDQDNFEKDLAVRGDSTRKVHGKDWSCPVDKKGYRGRLENLSK